MNFVFSSIVGKIDCPSVTDFFEPETEHVGTWK